MEPMSEVLDRPVLVACAVAGGYTGAGRLTGGGI